MNIEKIKNYNQVMLSVITTIAVAFAVVGLFSFIFFMLNEVFRVFDKPYEYQQTGIPAEDAYTDKDGELMNKLYLAYDFPDLADTANLLYIIPISYRTDLELQNDYSRKYRAEKSSYENYGGEKYFYQGISYLNLVVYDAKTGKAETMFKQKMLLGSYEKKYFKDDILVFMEAALIDSNKDRKITMEDETALFIYSMRNKILKQLKYKDKSVVDFSFVPNSKDLIIRFGVDESKRTKSESNSDLSVLCKYDYALDKLLIINDVNLQKELNLILEKK